jgi:NADH-quinone oxidoreductase subunit N
MNLHAALPELVLLATAALILVVDLFVSDARRNVTYALAMIALLAVAVVTWLFLSNGVLLYAFGVRYVVDPMTSVL